MGTSKCSLVLIGLLALSCRTYAQSFGLRGSTSGGLFGSGGESEIDLNAGDNSGYPGETNGYLPPIGGSPSNNVPAFSKLPKEPEDNDGRVDQSTNTQPQFAFPPAPAALPPIGCPAAMICVEEQYCTMLGMISETPVTLSSEQVLRRVPIVDCRNPDNGVVGKCCRDPNYVDPWPAGNLPANYSGGFDEQGFPTFLNISKTRPKKPVQTVQVQPIRPLRPQPQHPANTFSQIQPQPTFQFNKVVPQQPNSFGQDQQPQLVVPQQPKQPAFQPQQPVFQPQQPAFEPQQPAFQPQQPKQPTFQSQQPAFQPQQPKQPAFQPQQPKQPAFQPQQPKQPAFQPQQPAIQPQQPAFEPQQPTFQPQQPKQPAFQPQQPTFQPQQPTFQPQQPTFQPQQPTFQPQQPTFQPQQPKQPAFQPQQPKQPAFQPQQPKQPAFQPAPFKPQQPAPFQLQQPQQPETVFVPQTPEKPEVFGQQPEGPSVFQQPEQPQQTHTIQVTHQQPKQPAPFRPQQPAPFKPQQPAPFQPQQPIKFGQPVGTVNQPEKTFNFPSIPDIPNQISQLNPFRPQAPSDSEVINAPADVPDVPLATTQKPGIFQDFPNNLPSVSFPSFPGFGKGHESSPTNESPVVIAHHTPGAQCGIINQVQHPGGLGTVDTAFGEIPWMAMVLKNSEKKLLCSGAIVAPNLVLTAANCVYGLNPSDVSIKAGEWKLGYELKHEEPLPFEIVQVENIVAHPSYVHGAAGFDIAMLFLQNSIRLDQHIDTICVGDAPVVTPQRKCISTGWGKTILQVHAAGALMHKIDVDVLSNDQCRQRLQGAESAIDIDDSLVCAKAHKQSNNMCQVDVGGPLACDRGDGNYELVGVYSQDTGCLPTNQVATFTLIDSHWVNPMIAGSPAPQPEAVVPSGPAPLGHQQVQQPEDSPSRFHYHKPGVPCDCQQGTQPGGANQYLPPV